MSHKRYLKIMEYFHGQQDVFQNTRKIISVLKRFSIQHCTQLYKLFSAVITK